MGTKLYVGSLAYQTTEKELQELFSEHGTVLSAKIVEDRATGGSRGFGFVEMTSLQEAQKAIDALNGFSFAGRNLVVNEARPPGEKSGGGRTGGHW
ncbi:MAG: RNA-binding protein [Nitrospirae bacterium]|nr:RNA-binding protein [Nitrospirota bacterium]